MDINEIIDAITDGAADDNLELVINSARSRQKSLAQKMGATLAVGDKVKMNEMGRPKYLRGLSATVTGVGAETATVDFDDPFRARKYATNCRAPFTLLEKIEDA